MPSIRDAEIFKRFSQKKSMDLKENKFYNYYILKLTMPIAAC